MAMDPGVPKFSNQWEFSDEQWSGIILSGSIAAIFSLVANAAVILVHSLLIWLRPYVVNRLSLRMIVVACILNTLFCVSQLFVDGIPSNVTSCRAFAYILTASDTMACMCLAMIGFNLVTVFVFKIPRSITLEAMYYVAVALSGLLVTIVPAFAGNSKGPQSASDSDGLETCWYHYYFDGRINNIFNWMWYYGWLMFSLLFAAICAAVSIKYVTKKQKSFTGALNVFTTRKKDVRAMALLRKYGDNNVDIFRKISRRCICYPLVPFITKSWGVGIEIAAAVHHTVPYPIYVIDRVFSCLFGLMVGCIYFTDPAIIAAFKEFIDMLKTKYVYDYFVVKYQPGGSTDANNNVENLKSVEIAPFLRSHVNYITPTTLMEMEEFHNEEAPTNDIVDLNKQSFTLYNNVAGPPLPTLHVQPQAAAVNIRVSKRRYSVVKVLSTNGDSFFPTEPTEANTDNRQIKVLPQFFKRDKMTIVPMRRLSSIPTDTIDNSFTFQSKTSPRNTQKLVPFKYPLFAKLIHLVLIHIFRVKLVEVHNVGYDSNCKQDETTETFGDFPDERSDLPRNSPQEQLDVSKEKLQRNLNFASLDKLSTATRKVELPINNIFGHSSEGTFETRSTMETRMKPFPQGPLKRSSSINVASLQRLRYKNRRDLSIHSSAEESISGISSKSVAANIQKSSDILARVLGRRLSSKWIKITNGSPSLNKSLLTPEATFSKKERDEEMELFQTANGSCSEESFKQPGIQDTSAESVYVGFDEEDLGLSNYARELSPRPLSQYTLPVSIRKLSEKRQSIDIYTRSSCESIYNINKDQSFNLNELFYGTTLIHTGMENLDDLAGQSSGQSTPAPVVGKSRSKKMNNEQAGFIWGSTTVYNIFNWREDDDGEEQVSKITEPWDVERQLQEQLKLFQE